MTISPERILIVDGDLYICFGLKGALEDLYSVTVASSDAEALQQVYQHHFDLAIVDYRLNSTDGISLAKNLRVAQPSLRIILMTAYDSPAVEEEALKQGFRYLVKPFSTHTLLQFIRECEE
ncbi:MAG: response regulator [Anaerolineae bacterium]